MTTRSLLGTPGVSQHCSVSLERLWMRKWGSLWQVSVENAETLRGIICFKKICQGIHPHTSLLNLKRIQITLHSHAQIDSSKLVRSSHLGHFWSVNNFDYLLFIFSSQANWFTDKSFQHWYYPASDTATLQNLINDLLGITGEIITVQLQWGCNLWILTWSLKKLEVV